MTLNLVMFDNVVTSLKKKKKHEKHGSKLPVFSRNPPIDYRVSMSHKCFRNADKDNEKKREEKRKKNERGRQKPSKLGGEGGGT